jgi:DNA-nicking Smr family endonuclease
MGKRAQRPSGRRTSGRESDRRRSSAGETRSTLDPTRRAAGRDPAADRALFEQAVERIQAGDIDKHQDEGSGADSGRQARFARRVLRGEVEPAASIDLHGFDRERAASRLRRFLASATGEAVLVIHGRSGGIVRAAAIAELDRHPRVAEHITAPRHLGGDGARLVRLRR